MSRIVYCIVVLGIVGIMWYFAYRMWRKKQADEDMCVIDERTALPSTEEMRLFRAYKESLYFISKYAYHGRNKGLIYAYRMGYTAGKQSNDSEKEVSACLEEETN